MSRKKAAILIGLLLAAGAGIYAYRRLPPAALVLTGIVTTNDVIVSPQIAGQIGQLLVTEGDAVKKKASKKKGDVAEIDVPSGKLRFKVLTIAAADID